MRIINIKKNKTLKEEVENLKKVIKEKSGTIEDLKKVIVEKNEVIGDLKERIKEEKNVNWEAEVKIDMGKRKEIVKKAVAKKKTEKAVAASDQGEAEKKSRKRRAMVGLKPDSSEKAAKHDISENSDSEVEEKDGKERKKEREEDMEEFNEDDYMPLEFEQGVPMEFVDERVKDDKKAMGLNTAAYRSKDNVDFKVKCILNTFFLAVNKGSNFVYYRKAMRDEEGEELKDRKGNTIYKTETCALCYRTYGDGDIRGLVWIIEGKGGHPRAGKETWVCDKSGMDEGIGRKEKN